MPTFLDYFLRTFHGNAMLVVFAAEKYIITEIRNGDITLYGTFSSVIKLIFVSICLLLTRLTYKNLAFERLLALHMLHTCHLHVIRMLSNFVKGLR